MPTLSALHPPADTGACGTILGHSRHRNRRERPCDPCLKAGRVRRRELDAARVARPLSAHRLPLVFGQYAARPVMHDFVGAGDLSQCAGCFGWRDDYRHLGVAPASQPIADHPHTDPGDGRTECETCGKYVWPVIHSCKGVPVTARAWARFEQRRAGR